MSGQPELLTELDSVIEQLQSLRLQIAGSGDDSASLGSFELVDHPEPAPAGSVNPPTPQTICRVQRAPLDWELALLEARTVSDFEALDLRPLGSLVSGKLRVAGPGNWTPLLRVARAFRSGILARRQLAGVISLEDRVGLDRLQTLYLRDTIFVILRCTDYPEGLWTTNTRLYLNSIQDFRGRGESSDRQAVYQSFASQCEAAAYLRGAERSWPLKL